MTVRSHCEFDGSGDVDLLIETWDVLTLLERAHLKIALETRLGLPIDILCQAPTPAKRTRRALSGSPPAEWRRAP